MSTVSETAPPRAVPDTTRGNDIGAWWPDAAETLRAAGFFTRIAPVMHMSCRAFGAVHSQRPAGGTVMPYGSTVEIALCGDCLSWNDGGFHTGVFDFDRCNQDFAVTLLPLGLYVDAIPPGRYPHPRHAAP